MKRVVIFFLIVSSFLNAQIKEFASIRNVKFKPRESLIINKIIYVEIPKTWTYSITESLRGTINNICFNYKFYNAEFTPSITFCFYDNNKIRQEDIINKTIKLLFRKDVDITKIEDPLSEAIKKMLDKKASNIYVYVGNPPIAGTTFICSLYYKSINITLEVIFNLVYVERFTEEEWRYIMQETFNILTSIRKYN